MSGVTIELPTSNSPISLPTVAADATLGQLLSMSGVPNAAGTSWFVRGTDGSPTPINSSDSIPQNGEAATQIYGVQQGKAGSETNG